MEDVSHPKPLYMYEPPWTAALSAEDCDPGLNPACPKFSAFKQLGQETNMCLLLMCWPRDHRAYAYHASEMFGVVLLGVDLACDKQGLQWDEVGFAVHYVHSENPRGSLHDLSGLLDVCFVRVDVVFCEDRWVFANKSWIAERFGPSILAELQSSDG